MRVFLTGATGYIGGAVARTLRSHDHEVVALVRAESDTRALRDLGVTLITGDLSSLPALDGYDVIVHTAFSPKDEPAAIESFTAIERPLVYTSGCWMLGNTEYADEGSPVNPLEISRWRAPHEERVLGAGGAVVRPGCVYGGSQSLFKEWFAAAEQNRPIEIVGDGNNRWAFVDLEELGDFYARCVEQRAKGVLHAIDDTDATLNECASAIAPEAPVEHIPIEAAREKLGVFADALAVSQRISSTHTRQLIGWQPRKTVLTTIEEQWSQWRARVSS